MFVRRNKPASEKGCFTKIHPPRKYPIAQRATPKTALQKMQDAEVIVKQIEPTELVNSLVTPIKPNGDLRVCKDPLYVNKALKGEHLSFEHN